MTAFEYNRQFAMIMQAAYAGCISEVEAEDAIAELNKEFNREG